MSPICAVVAIFLLPVSAYALVRRLLSHFCNLLRQIWRLSTVTVSFDVKRRSAAVLVKPKVVFNGHTVADRQGWKNHDFLKKSEKSDFLI